MNSSERNARIIESLRIKPITHGQVHTFQIAIPESENQTILFERHQVLEESLTNHKSNLVPLIVRKTEAYSEEEEYEVVYGTDWCLVAKELDIEKLWVWVFDMTDEQAAAAKMEMEQLLGSSDPLTLDTPPAFNETQQIKSLLQQFEKSLQQKLEDVNNKIAQTSTNSTTNTSNNSEDIGIGGLSEQLEKLIEKKLEPMVKQIKEMDLKLNKFGYYAMTVAQLKAIVKERQLEGRSKMTTKDKLVTSIIESESSRS